MHEQSLTALLEALIFAAGRPVAVKELAQAADLSVADTELALVQLKQQINNGNRGVLLRQVAGGVQFFARAEYSPFIKRLFQPLEKPNLSQAALETLAIIAYRQPITRTEIELIRGVRVDAVLVTLQERGLITEIGRKDAPGRPILYGTTTVFLQSVGLNSLQDLPCLPSLE
ncbi:MAG: SMC-Scp complex subunit ScpB [Firmicutes bacterium]|jgi:segregation and condensation protein B|nr:SMC-Scp complex subunit ScpB [Bacillota bacterium]